MQALMTWMSFCSLNLLEILLNNTVAQGELIVFHSLFPHTP